MSLLQRVRAWFADGTFEPDPLPALRAAVDRGTDCWAAREPGECYVCGHEWIAGEIIGVVHLARDHNGRRNPRARRACCVCVEQVRVQGDPSHGWGF